METPPTPTPEPTIPTIYRESAMGILRSFLTMASGILVSKGLLAATATNEFIQLGLGAGIFLLTISWSAYVKHKAKAVLMTALVEADISEAQAKATVKQGISVPSVLTSPSDVPVPKG